MYTNKHDNSYFVVDTSSQCSCNFLTQCVIFTENLSNFYFFCVVQAFGWFALGAYIADLVFAIIEFRKSRISRSEVTTHQETTVTTTSARY